MSPQIWGWPPAFPPPVLCLISRSSSFDWHTQQITFSQQNFKRFESFWRRFWRYSQAYAGFDTVNHSKSFFITTGNHHAGETFILAPLLFSLAPQCHPSFFILESPLEVWRLKEMILHFLRTLLTHVMFTLNLR